MADLIDRQALIGWLKKVGRFMKCCENTKRMRETIGGIISHIEKIPAVDAEPVVRCKDCKHYKRGIVFKDTMFCYRPVEGGDAIIRIVKDNDFCSYGKRRC